MITVNGDNIDDIRRQIGFEKPLDALIVVKSMKSDYGRVVLPGCSVKFVDKEFPIAYDSVEDALVSIGTYLRNFDAWRKSQEVKND